MQDHELYMRRCLQLARLGAGFVAPNPMVGAVLVYGDKIIGEGYHKQYGQPHAEVNCMASVAEEDRHLVSLSTLYVSLEPCAHFGKTPPCADLVISHSIPRVVIGCRDPFEQVDGKGIEKLRNAGIEVIVGVLEKECITLNKRFFVFNVEQRPYIVLKWAQSSNGMIAKADGSPVPISNVFTNRLVHNWRSEEAGIMVGTNTALNDNPQLSTRLWTGNHPVRLVLDLNLRLPAELNVFDNKQRTIILNTIKEDKDGETLYYKLEQDQPLVAQILNACYELRVQSILVEGGAKLLQAFIDSKMWDEARVIASTEIAIDNGLSAPILHHHILDKTQNSLGDIIHYYTPALTRPTEAKQ